jgi:hypothetical protein
VTESTAERYLRLGLQLGRHVDGMVDAYFGPPQLAAEVDAEPPVEPRELVAAADLLLDELDDAWLRDQVLGLRTYAGVLAGEPISYADEVEGCYGIRPSHTDEDTFLEAHARLEELLPGGGSLGERKARWDESIRVPPDAIAEIVAAVIDEARAQTRALIDLPEGEDVSLEIVNGVPWLGYCEYLGELQSRISVNVDLPMSAVELVVLAIHETYPGHHAERCVKEERLVWSGGLLEETIVLVPTPQSLISEGIATVAPFKLLSGAGGAAFASIFSRAGVRLDLERALAIENALRPCRWAEVNAALLLHGDGASDEQVQAYLERWGLLSPEVAAHLVRFLHEPTSRSYILTYAAGYEVCSAYVAAGRSRFGRLLAEQVRVLLG